MGESQSKFTEENPGKIPKSGFINIDLDRKPLVELSHMLHCKTVVEPGSIKEIRGIYQVYRMKSRQLNVAYTVFNKIVVEKDYNTGPIFKYFTGNSSRRHFDQNTSISSSLWRP